jgi:hypothetical protein
LRQVTPLGCSSAGAARPLIGLDLTKCFLERRVEMNEISTYSNFIILVPSVVAIVIGLLILYYTKGIYKNKKNNQRLTKKLQV